MKVSLSLPTVVLWFPIVCLCSDVYNIDDTQLFKIDYLPLDSTFLSEPASDELETILLRTAKNEEYTCTLPKLEAPNQEGEEPYVGNNALEILQQLFLTQSCAYRLEHYWTYELCHGRYIRQFHEEREGKTVKVSNVLVKFASICFKKFFNFFHKNLICVDLDNLLTSLFLLFRPPNTFLGSMTAISLIKTWQN